MKIGRRGFLQMMPAAAITVRTGAEAAARDLSKVEIAGLGNGSYGTLASGQSVNEAPAFARAMDIPGLRAEIESLIFENNRAVSRIDPDLAVMRSFSLNAKICFQRQRNVAHDMQEKAGKWKYPYQRMMQLVGLG